MAESFALTRRDGNVIRESDVFDQQGTVEWTNVANLSFQASVAVLSRLSSAGLEPLTVAVGQAVCGNLTLGPEGERRLQDALSRLKSFSSYSNALWFGLGIRHIVRTLVQTSQGASCVALCAALAETHHQDISTLVLIELAKRYTAPQELSPSYRQWSALVKACAGVFKSTSFGLKVHTLLQTAKRTYTLPFLDLYLREPSAPADLAQVIQEMSLVKTGIKRSIEVIGGADCAWVIVFADWLLGLRVQLRSEIGELLYINYDGEHHQAEVSAQYNFDISEAAVRKAGESFVLRNGADLIKRQLGVQAVISFRCAWDHVLAYALGSNVLDSLLDVDESVADLVLAAGILLWTNHHGFPSGDELFGISGARVSILDKMVRLFPELQQLQHFRPQLSSGDIIGYKRAWCALVRDCGCATCNSLKNSDYSTTRDSETEVCIVRLVELVIFVSYQHIHTEFAVPLLPTPDGLRKLYSYTEQTSHDFSEDYTLTMLELERSTTKDEFFISRLTACARMRGEQVPVPLCPRFYTLLYTGCECPQNILGPVRHLCSYAWHGLCFYLEVLTGLSDQYVRQCRIHVTPGGIECGSEPRDALWGRDNAYQRDYPPSQVVSVGTNRLLPADQFPSTCIKSELVVSNLHDLKVAYRLFDEKGEFWVNPGQWASPGGPLASALRSRKNGFGCSSKEFVHCEHRRAGQIRDFIRSPPANPVHLWALKGFGPILRRHLPNTGRILLCRAILEPLARCAAILNDSIEESEGQVRFYRGQDPCLQCLLDHISRNPPAKPLVVSLTGGSLPHC